jgi:hypothetical protein
LPGHPLRGDRAREGFRVDRSRLGRLGYLIRRLGLHVLVARGGFRVVLFRLGLPGGWIALGAGESVVLHQPGAETIEVEEDVVSVLGSERRIFVPLLLGRDRAREVAEKFLARSGQMTVRRVVVPERGHSPEIGVENQGATGPGASASSRFSYLSRRSSTARAMLLTSSSIDFWTFRCSLMIFSLLVRRLIKKGHSRH